MAANYAFNRVSGIVDRVLVWIHGRRLGLYNDGQQTSNNALVLDGVVVGSTRTGANSLKGIATALATTGAVTLTGTVAGDTTELVLDLTSLTDVTSNFESTISVSGQIQQTTAGSAHACLFFVNPQAAA